jgi:hypothetical protein
MRPLKNIKFFCPAILLIFITSSGWCQCVPTGATSPSTITNSAAAGVVAWSNLANAVSSNNSHASCGITLGVLASAQTHYIQTQGHGLAIPATATVCGIEVRVERHASGLLIGSSVKDQTLFLMKAGSPVGTNHASSSAWPGSDAVAVYGSTSDLWGTTWTPAQINASNFGVQLSALMNAGVVSLFLSANIDAITITVYYTTTTLPVELISFSGQQENAVIRLQWQTASEKNSAYFDLEKMNEDYSWNTIERVNSGGNSVQVNSYGIDDQSPAPINYYRLRQVDRNGQSSLSKSISVEYEAAAGNKPRIYPVPASSVLHIDSDLAVQKLEIISPKGFVTEAEFEQQEKSLQLNIASLTAGIYFLKIHTDTEVIMTRFVKD